MTTKAPIPDPLELLTEAEYRALSFLRENPATSLSRFMKFMGYKNINKCKKMIQTFRNKGYILPRDNRFIGYRFANL